MGTGQEVTVGPAIPVRVRLIHWLADTDKILHTFTFHFMQEACEMWSVCCPWIWATWNKYTEKHAIALKVKPAHQKKMYCHCLQKSCKATLVVASMLIHLFSWAAAGLSVTSCSSFSLYLRPFFRREWNSDEADSLWNTKNMCTPSIRRWQLRQEILEETCSRTWLQVSFWTWALVVFSGF